MIHQISFGTLGRISTEFGIEISCRFVRHGHRRIVRISHSVLGLFPTGLAGSIKASAHHFHGFECVSVMQIEGAPGLSQTVNLTLVAITSLICIVITVLTLAIVYDAFSLELVHQPLLRLMVFLHRLLRFHQIFLNIR